MSIPSGECAASTSTGVRPEAAHDLVLFIEAVAVEVRKEDEVVGASGRESQNSH
jgi:hypothetical protein